MKNQRWSQFWAVCVAALLTLMNFINNTQAQVPLAGTVISVRAAVEYYNAEIGALERKFSNSVQATVREVIDISVVKDQEVTVFPGSAARFFFSVSNNGNSKQTVTLSTPDASGFLPFLTKNTFLDQLGNGTIEPEQNPVFGGDLNQDFEFEPGQIRQFIVTAQMPDTANTGDRGGLDFQAQTADGSVRDSAQGIAIISLERLYLRKETNRKTARPDDTIMYRFPFRNNGQTVETNFQVTVDGQAKQGFLIRDEIPNNTVLSSAKENARAETLYHIFGDAQHTYRSDIPDDLNSVDAIGYLIPSPLRASTSADFEFNVQVNSNATSGVISNEAVLLRTNEDDQQVATPTNLVLTRVHSESVGTLAWYATGQFQRPITASSNDTAAFLQFSSGACNLTSEVDRVDAVIRTKEGDQERVLLQEVTPRSGIFRVNAVEVADEFVAVQDNELLLENSQLRRADGVVNAVDDDLVTASLNCGGLSYSAPLLIEPKGVVFNSTTNDVVPGVQVQLRDGAGQAIQVQTTDAKGRFAFNTVPPGRYSVFVVANSGLKFPSTADPESFPSRNVVSDRSYGRPFVVTEQTERLFFDIPLDRDVYTNGLLLKKEANIQRAERGDLIVYELTLKSSLEQAVTDVTLVDTLPPGFTYVPRSARMSGQTLIEKNGSVGSDIEFTLPDIEANVEKTLSYVARVGATAGFGQNINIAQISANSAEFGDIESNVAIASVEIEPGKVFQQEASLVGKVFLDRNGDGIQTTEADEPGVPGVRILFQDGTSVITDRYGRYSLYGFRPITYVARIDETTLPKGTRVSLTSNRQAGDPKSRFIDFHKGELHKADFALQGEYDEVLVEIQNRVAQLEKKNSLDHLLNRELTIERPNQGKRVTAQNMGRNAGIITVDGQIKSASDIVGDVAQGTKQVALIDGVIEDQDLPLQIATTQNLEKQIRSLDNSLDFLDLKDEMTVSKQVLSVRAKGHNSAQVSLIVNGELVSNERLGQVVKWEKAQVAAYEFVAVQLRPGENTLLLKQVDHFGIERGQKQITIYAPGRSARVEILAPDEAVGDGASPLPVVLRILDSQGIPTQSQVIAALEVSGGKFDAQDIDPGSYGLQVLIDQGEALVDLIPPNTAGTQTITVTTDFGTFKKDIKFSPHLRPLIAVGVVEGAVNLGRRGKNISHLISKDELNAFEQTQEGVRGALYLKGKIKGDALLTVAYDSDKDTKERLFRDIRPDEFYPIYGDESIKEFDAQSASQLYVKVEKGSSYILYGDYQTSENYDGLKLGSYNRSVTGGKAHLEFAQTTVTAFAAQISHNQRVVELPARGISGPYDLNVSGKIVTNSEKVEIITRDRRQTGVILKTQTLTRFSDYRIRYSDNSIIFTRPISGFDDQLNPRSIRVTLELDSDGEKYWIYGGNIRGKLRDSTYAGASIARSQEPGNSLTLGSAYVEAQVGENGKVIAELAHSRSEKHGDGFAGRIGYEFHDENLTLNAKIAQAGEHFYSPNASLKEGQREASFDVTRRISEAFSITSEGRYSHERTTNEKRFSTSLRGNYALSREVTLHGGLRYSFERGNEKQYTTSLFGGVEWSPEFLPNVSTRLEYEQDLAALDHARLAVGADYTFEKGRVYAQHELISSLRGSFGIGPNRSKNTTAAGFEYKKSENVRTFAEIRRRPNDGSFASEVANGVRGQWDLTDDLSAEIRLERTLGLSGGGKERAAVATALRYIEPNDVWAGRLNLEWNKQEASQTWYASSGVVYNLDDTWSVLGQNRLSIVLHKAEDDELENRLRVGLAYRPTDHNLLNALGWYEWIYLDRHENTSTSTNLWALAANWQPVKEFTLTGRYAGKWASRQASVVSETTLLQQFSVRLAYDVTDKLDVGLTASTLLENSFQNPTYSFGLEAGYRVWENVWPTIGYNFIGYEEQHLGSGFASGPYVRVRAKLDEGLFQWLQ
ncbi:conserved repeat domain-containing protein [Pseudovibrio denitrificans]|uniref:Conserved repeat domain-containing protein n=1 Tax=Pseudovibrio denitrificans TaxID=258256 RepID=A0A1I7DYE8_9HYPH|nr:SdrD B-like domain-containing protein [Pseudovibrio denitrificans]SFU16702.1 conserved repeat domain-containing protein [Pseudovibrio denitrificans]